MSSAPARPRPRTAALGLLLLGACAAPVARQAATTPVGGAVVSEHPLATEVGLDVLARGGNAADAAVATALALAVVFPVAGNLGGGGFALVVPAAGEAVALDFRETAPAGYAAGLYLDADGRAVPERSVSGALSIGIPGSPAGLHALWREHGSGRLSFAEVAAGALALARDGFPVDPWLAEDLEDEALRAHFNVTARELFYPGGRALQAGELLVQPELARTLVDYVAEGPRLFYDGRVAGRILAEIRRTPVAGLGLPPPDAIRPQDLRGYEVRSRVPLRGSFRGREVIAFPPPSSGGLVVLQALAVLAGLPLEAERGAADGPDDEPLTGRMAHWWIEALRAAFADRALHMGDPDFHAVPVEALLDPAWTAARRMQIGERARPDVAPWAPAPAPESPQTTHLSVVDRDGDAVSLTTTLNSGYGSGVMVEGAGFLLNNELDDFAIQPDAPNQFGLVGGAANAIAPGKRPLSSMTPTVVRGPAAGELLVIGSPGGPRIITAVFQVMLRVLVLDQPLATAVRAPRLHQQWQPVDTWLEDVDGFRFPADVEAELRARGQPLARRGFTFASVQAIRVGPDGSVEVASDPRRGGAGGIEGRGVDAPAPPR